MMTHSRKRPRNEESDNDNDYYNYDNTTRKAGKWSMKEETFAQSLITLFQQGKLYDCDEGATLRSYLSKKLNCSPMRISKKYAGLGIGKHIYNGGCAKQSEVKTNKTGPFAAISSSYDYRNIDRLNNETAQAFYAYSPPHYPPFYSQNNYQYFPQSSYFQRSNTVEEEEDAAPNEFRSLTSESTCFADSIPKSSTNIASTNSREDDFSSSYDSTEEAEIWKDVLEYYCGSSSMDEDIM